MQVNSMKHIETGSFVTPSEALSLPDAFRLVSWNVNRGQHLNETIEFLAGTRADVILLQETDVNARRTNCRNIALEVAKTLQMNYVFGCEFEELGQGCCKASAYHGQATLSRLPLSNSRLLRFRAQSDFWYPRWFIPKWRPFQRRLGGRMALVCQIDVAERKLVLYNVHLESRGNDTLRYRQFSELCKDIHQFASDVPVILAGDFNFDLCKEPAAAVLRDLQFDNPFGCAGRHGPAVNSRLKPSRAIDWILTRGPLITSASKFHDSIRASDHWPLSISLRWSQFRPSTN
jgi:endonuclease/exonuclease/phosphatase family metal-dependent hydrolase